MPDQEQIRRMFACGLSHSGTGRYEDTEEIVKKLLSNAK